MLQLLPDDDQLQIVDAVQRYVQDEFPVSRLRTAGDQQGDLARWEEIASLGYLTMSLPESSGGAGFGLAEEVLVFRELGRGLISPAATATTIAAHVLADSGAAEKVAAIVGGTMRAAPGVCTASGPVLVVDSEGAELIVVRNADALLVYERGALRKLGDRRSLDDSLGLEAVDIVGEPFAVGGQALLRRYLLLIAAMQVAVGEEARDMAVSYAKDRTQFGKPIGSFQAIKHRCADMAVASEMAWAQLLFATVSERDGVPGSAYQVNAACLLAGRSAVENSTGSIQVHGGIGFTAEMDAHRFIKRARVLEQLGGDPTEQRAALLAEPFPASPA